MPISFDMEIHKDGIAVWRMKITGPACAEVTSRARKREVERAGGSAGEVRVELRV